MEPKKTELTDFAPDEQTDDETSSSETNDASPLTNQSSTDEKSHEHSTGNGGRRIDDSEAKDGPICPYYHDDLTACKNKIGDDLVETLRLDKIACGHAIHYLGSEVDATLKRSTVNDYSSCLRQYVDFLHGRGVTVCEAEMSHVREFFAQLAQRNLKDDTIKGYRAAITGLYKDISVYRDIETNVQWVNIREMIDPSEYNTPPSMNREPLEKEEIKKLYEAAGSFRDRLTIRVGVELGPRNGAIRSIEIDDINFEDNTIELTDFKGGGEPYTLPISNQLSLLLRRWVDEERKAYPGAEGNDYLFPSRDGGKISSSSLTRIVSEAAEAAGIQEKTKSEAILSDRQKEIFGTDNIYYSRVTPHVLRHTFNNLLDQAGIPREARSRALNHESEDVTKKYYDDKDDEYKELIKELFSERGSMLDD